MDTGVGRTAYSIMEQGKIDMILSSRPEDRRTIFEEAAGITKYKSQKKEALKKLENTEANLLRLADVIREVKRQVGSLQRQAAKAKRFQVAQEELIRMELRIGRHYFNQYTSTIAKLEAVVGSARVKQDEVRLRVEDQEAKTVQAKTDLSAVETEFNNLREEENNLRMAVERAQQKSTSNRSRVEEFTRLAEQAEHEVVSTTERITSGEQELVQLNAQVEQSRQSQIETQQKFNAAQQGLNELVRKLGSARNEMGQIEQNKLQQERQVQRQEQEAAGLQAQLIGFQERFEALRMDEPGLQIRVEELTAGLNALVEQVKHEESVLRDKKNAVQQAQQKQRECEEALRLVEKQSSDANRQLQTLASASGCFVSVAAAKYRCSSSDPAASENPGCESSRNVGGAAQCESRL